MLYDSIHLNAVQYMHFYLVALAKQNSISHITREFVLKGFVNSSIAEKKTIDVRSVHFWVLQLHLLRMFLPQKTFKLKMSIEF